MQDKRRDKPQEKQKVLIILGPTSSGKSDLAVHIAKKFNGEVVSADSRQVYKGLDIGTGKITKAEMKNVPHHLLDVASPRRVYTVAQYKKTADKKIAEILKKGKLPIIAGGTGFYIDAVADGKILPEVKPNKELRKKLEQKTTAELFKEIKKLDKVRAKEIGKKNKVRLIRAIEIARALGKVPKVKKESPKYEFIKIGLDVPQEILDQRIHSRLLKRLKKGMLAEAKRLHDKGLSWRRMQELGLEYRHMALYLTGKTSKSEMIEKLYTEIRKYSKRQKTWWKKDKEIKWFTQSKVERMTKTEIKKAESFVKNSI